jgi:hypothetical protein
MPKRSRTAEPKPKTGAPARDENQLAFDAVQRVVALTEGSERPQKDPAAVALGRRGGLKGGPARVAKMTKEQLRASALKAARARWDRKPDSSAR